MRGIGVFIVAAVWDACDGEDTLLHTPHQSPQDLTQERTSIQNFFGLIEVFEKKNY